MKNKNAILVGSVLAAGAVAYFLTTEKGKQVKQTISDKAKQLNEELKTSLTNSKENVTNEVKTTANNAVADFILNHKSTILNAASVLAPIVLKRMFTRK